MAETSKVNESKGTRFCRIVNRPDGDMKMPKKSAGIDPESQRRAALQRLLLRFSPGDQVDRNDSAIPGGWARPPTRVLKRSFLSPEEPLQIATARLFSIKAPPATGSCTGQWPYDPPGRCSGGTVCSRPLERLWETCAEQRLLFSRHSPPATCHPPLVTRSPRYVCSLRRASSMVIGPGSSSDSCAQ